MSSHILQEIEATVNRIIIIDQGKIVADGSTKSLLKKFTGNTELKLVIKGATKTALNKIPTVIDGISQMNISKQKNTHVISLEYKKEIDLRESIFNYIVKNKWTLLEMNPKSANLEDIFRKLTN